MDVKRVRVGNTKKVVCVLNQTEKASLVRSLDTLESLRDNLADKEKYKEAIKLFAPIVNEQCGGSSEKDQECGTGNPGNDADSTPENGADEGKTKGGSKKGAAK